MLQGTEELTTRINNTGLLRYLQQWEDTHKRPWGYIDHKGKYRYGSLRILISRLLKQGKVLRWHGKHCPQLFVLANGKLTTNRMGVPVVNYEQITVTLTDKLLALTYGSFMMHDIRLLTNCAGSWQRLIDNGHIPNAISKDIVLPQLNFTDFRYAVVTVHHTDSISIMLACSYSPLVRTMSDMLALFGYAGEIKSHIENLIGLKMPSPTEWIHTQSHINRDAEGSFSDKEFEYTFQMYGDAAFRIYNKQFGRERKVRIEKIDTKKRRLDEFAEQILFRKASELDTLS